MTPSGAASPSTSAAASTTPSAAASLTPSTPSTTSSAVSSKSRVVIGHPQHEDRLLLACIVHFKDSRSEKVIMV